MPRKNAWIQAVRIWDANKKTLNQKGHGRSNMRSKHVGNHHGNYDQKLYAREIHSSAASGCFLIHKLAYRIAVIMVQPNNLTSNNNQPTAHVDFFMKHLQIVKEKVLWISKLYVFP